MHFGSARAWLRWCAGAVAVYGLTGAWLWVWLPLIPLRTISLPEPVRSAGISIDNRTLIAGADYSWAYPAWCRFEILPSDQLVEVSRDDFGRLQWSHSSYCCSLTTGQRLAPIRLEDYVDQSLGYVAFSADGKSLAFTKWGQNKEVIIWDIPSRTSRAILKNQDGPLAFSPDGQSVATIASDSREPTVKVWTSNTGTEQQRLEEPRIYCRVDKDLPLGNIYLAFTADGSRVGMLRAIGSLERARALAFGEPMLLPGVAVDAGLTLVRMWDFKTGKLQVERLTQGFHLTRSPLQFGRGFISRVVRAIADNYSIR